jgi:NADH-quinone oxidoreductase subunit F
MLKKIVSANFELKDSHKIDVALENDRYNSLDKLFTMKKEDIIEDITTSKLQGKGGGGSAAGPKWKLTAKEKSDEKYLIINADESEPGTFKDRQIIEYDPHLLIEGIVCASYATNANNCYIYIRGEYVFWAQRLNEAINEAYDKGLLGKNIKNSGFDLDVVVHRGGGAYICGEKSALIESLEGKRGHPRLKPHAKECEWFFGKPATVNNVETIASVPFIINNGSQAYLDLGTKGSPGTMLFGLSGHIKHPGIYELEYGERMLEVIEKLGGGIKNGKKLKAVIPGGVSCPILTAQEVEQATLDYETLWDLGTSLGTGGMIVIDEDTSMLEVGKNIMEFYHHESCGQCTPCREGCGWINKLLEKILDGNGTNEDVDTILDICDTMNGKTVCVFAPAVSAIIVSLLNKFRDEFISSE